MPSTERRALDRGTYATEDTSRLACCVQLRPELNEMIAVVGQNRSAEGEWFTGSNRDAF